MLARRAGASLLLVAAVTLLSSLASVRSAHALSQIAIRFDFTAGSSFSLLGGALVTPPDGSIDVASLRLLVEADAGGIVPGGVVTLSELAFSGTIAGNVGGVADVDGSFSGTQVGTLTGVLAPGGTGASFASDLDLDFAANIGCVGSGCAILGLPVTESGVFGLPIGLLPLIDLSVPGAARIDATVPVEIGGVLGELRLLGVETSRSAVPELGASWLLLLAAGGLWAQAVTSRSRPVSHS